MLGQGLQRARVRLRLVCTHHHGVCLAAAGNSICKDGTIDAIHRGLDYPFTCTGIDLHWQAGTVVMPAHSLLMPAYAGLQSSGT